MKLMIALSVINALSLPVDCIDIEPIRSPEVFGKTSDGTGKESMQPSLISIWPSACFVAYVPQYARQNA